MRVDWRDPARQAADGWARGWFNYGGLNRPVTLTRLGRTELGALTVRTRLRGSKRARVDVSVRVRNRGDARTIHLRGALRHGGTTIPVEFAPAGVGGGTSRTIAASVTIPDPALWSPDDPQRYDLRIDDPGEATLQRPIGLREISWDAGGLALNGEPLVLRGAALPPDARGHGDALTDRRRGNHRRGAAQRRRERDALAAAALTEHARAPRRRRDPRLAGRRPLGARGPLARRHAREGRRGERPGAADRRGAAGAPGDRRVDARQRGLRPGPAGRA